MQDSEKLCLKWNDFQENLNSAFGGFRNGKEFSDVTLACEDGTQIETHKVILASSSPFFKEILKRNKHPHPLIYMRGIKAEEFVAIVDFLYFGEANVDQESLEAFLGLAEELKLKGLTGSNEHKDEVYGTMTEPLKAKLTQKKQHMESIPDPLNIYKPDAKTEPFSMTPLTVGTDVQQLEEEVKSMMEMSETMLTQGNQTRRARICKVCGKEGHRANIKTHIEANHIISNVSHSCDICGKISRSRHGLRLHKAKEH